MKKEMADRKGIKKKPSLPRSTKEMSQEELRQILIKKKECNEIAQKIVEAMLEPNVDILWIQENLQFINQCHFDDIVTERSISLVCGYPLCDTKLPKTPNKKFHISYHRKEVYDTSVKFKYCSDFCWKASEYLKSQMLTSPLWYREHEVIPKFSFMAKTPKNIGRSLEKTDIESNNTEHHEESSICNKSNLVVNSVKKAYCQKKSEEYLKEKSDNSSFNSIKKVEKSVEEWFNGSTLIYLFGEDRVKEMFHDKTRELQLIRDGQSSNNKNKNIEHCLRLFSLLDISASDEPVNLKPLPDYNSLKKDTENLIIKYRSFMSGQLVLDDDLKEERVEDDSESSYELPMVDSQAQMHLRRKVLLERLANVLKNIGQALGIYDAIEMCDFRELVRHFVLESHNVTFSPSESILVCLIIIRLLAERSSRLKNAWISKSVLEKVTLILLDYNLPANYLDNVTEWLCNPDAIIKKLR